MPHTPSRIRILVAGLGSIGRRHARLLSEHRTVELLLCDTVSSHLIDAQKEIPCQVSVIDDYARALSARPDLVMLCTPNYLHAHMGLQAIEAGADVFVEKPITETVADGKRLVEAAKDAGRRLHVGYMLRFDVGLHTLKRIVDEGGIGSLCGGRAMVGSYITLLNSRIRDKEDRAGSLVVDYSHEIDYIRWFFGEVANVQAVGATLGNNERTAKPNIFQATFEMASGALVQLHLDYLQYPQRRVLELFGDRGTLSYDFMTGEIRHYTYDREHRWVSLNVPPMLERVDNLYREEHADLLRSRTGGVCSLVSGSDALTTLEVAEKAIAKAGYAIASNTDSQVPRLVKPAPSYTR